MGLLKARSGISIGVFVLTFIGGGAFSFLAHAVDFSSTNFILRDPVITVEGGRSTSASFEFFSSTGQSIIGESTSAGFIHRAGFFYFKEVSVVPPAPPVVGSGGYTFFGGQVTFSGRAYPQSEVILLKDGQIVSTTLADGAANFSLNLKGLSTGDYLFSLYSKDYTGKSSRLISFYVSAIINTITTSDAAVYDHGDNIGGIITMTDALRVTGGTALLHDIAIWDKDKQNAVLEIDYWSESPSGTYTDNAAQVIAGDEAKHLGTIEIAAGDYKETGAVSKLSSRNLGITLKG
ncbi:hypothetical protein IIB97_02485 [Patescibacteria group bacterium]|nr:hypothetical protein [Patescibacteria group bacterium]